MGQLMPLRFFFIPMENGLTFFYWLFMLCQDVLPTFIILCKNSLITYNKAANYF
jgi:hypothetical protein